MKAPVVTPAMIEDVKEYAEEFEELADVLDAYRRSWTPGECFALDIDDLLDVMPVRSRAKSWKHEEMPLDRWASLATEIIARLSRLVKQIDGDLAPDSVIETLFAQHGGDKAKFVQYAKDKILDLGEGLYFEKFVPGHIGGEVFA